jgi:hypothetical protein
MTVGRGRLGIALLVACLAAVLAPPAQAAEPERTLTAIAGSYDVAAGALSGLRRSPRRRRPR